MAKILQFPVKPRIRRRALVGVLRASQRVTHGDLGQHAFFFASLAAVVAVGITMATSVSVLSPANAVVTTSR